MSNQPGNIRETEVAARIVVCELFMIESEQVQDRGVQVVRTHFSIDRLTPQFVG